MKKIAHPARRAKKAVLLVDELSQHMEHLAEREASAALAREASAREHADQELRVVIEWIGDARKCADDLWYALEDLAAAAGVAGSATRNGACSACPAEENLTAGRSDMFKLVQALRHAQESAQLATRALKNAGKAA